MKSGFGRFFMIISLTLIISGCYDLSNRKIPDGEPTELLTDGANSDITSSSESGLMLENENDASAEFYSEYPFTAEDEEYLAATVFVGDNLPLGLLSYDLVTFERIIADENATAANISDISVEYGGGSVDVLTALVNANPANIIITLGSNYLGIENPDEYTGYYMDFITLARSYCKNANFIVISAPPVNAGSIFGDNEAVVKYNTALKQAVENLGDTNVRYLDIGVELKNARGELKSNYGSGDNKLLTERGYHAVLWQICNF